MTAQTPHNTPEAVKLGIFWTADLSPEHGSTLGFHPDWIDADACPDGIRPISYAGDKWASWKWSMCQDYFYETDDQPLLIKIPISPLDHATIILTLHQQLTEAEEKNAKLRAELSFLSIPETRIKALELQLTEARELLRRYSALEVISTELGGEIGNTFRVHTVHDHAFDLGDLHEEVRSLLSQEQSDG